MNIKIAGALFGFIFGFAGYIVVRFSVMPVRRYRRLKKAVQSDINAYDMSIAENTWKQQGKKVFKNTRKKITDLNDCYSHDIPAWYRIMLRRRKESPQEAAKHLMDLANIQQETHALKRLDNARKALLLPGSGENQNL